MGQSMLDTVREIHTPEGVALRLPAAGPVPRALAWLIDAAIRFGCVVLAGIVLAVLGATGMGVWLVLLFVMTWGYPILFEVLWHGQTPGKRALGLKVVAADGAPVGWMASITRNLLRVADGLPMFYAFGLLSCLIDPWNRRLGDLAASTLVIHVAPTHAIADLTVQGVATPLWPMQPGEQEAVIAFAERLPKLSAERQQELADIAQPLTGERGPMGVVRLAGIANWLLGR
ncbi:MAG: RDD family protein [Proteobacteria bacterium]|nr:RDD family protein [Pseudomonadota bacterium]